jgi:hypothetical protein
MAFQVSSFAMLKFYSKSETIPDLALWYHRGASIFSKVEFVIDRLFFDFCFFHAKDKHLSSEMERGGRCKPKSPQDQQLFYHLSDQEQCVEDPATSKDRYAELYCPPKNCLTTKTYNAAMLGYACLNRKIAFISKKQKLRHGQARKT